jgi:hypothetical protein
MARVELAADCACNLGESPIWEERSQRLYHIDINGRTLLAYEPSTRAPPCRPVALHALVGTIVPRASGGLLACREDDIVPVNPDTGVVGNALAEVPLEHRARPRERFTHARAALRCAAACGVRAWASAARACLAQRAAALAAREATLWRDSWLRGFAPHCAAARVPAAASRARRAGAEPPARSSSRGCARCCASQRTLGCGACVARRS